MTMPRSLKMFSSTRMFLLLLVVLTAITSTGAGDSSSSSSNEGAAHAGTQNDVKQQQHRRQQRFATASVTSDFTRPPAHPALDFTDARVTGSASAAVASSSTDRKQQSRASVAGALRGEYKEDDEGDEASTIPEQVHLLPRGPGEMTVVWASAVAVEPGAVVRFGRVKHDDAAAEDDEDALELTMEATVSSTAYTAQICLGEPNNVEAVMGNPHPVSMANLTYLANTSRWAPEDAANYRVIEGPDDVVPPRWFGTPPWGKAICLAYNNPDSQYQSPLVNAAHMGSGGGGSLVAGATYRYRLPGDAKTTRRTFRAPPSAATGATSSSSSSSSSSAAPVAVFGVVGDTGQTEVTHAVFQHLQSMKDLDVLLHTGDLSYADGFPPRWDSFGRLAEPLMSKVPVLTVPGNHDVTLNGLESVAYHSRYPTPYALSGSASPLWWSLDVGPAHVIGLSSYAPVTSGGGQGGAGPTDDFSFDGAKSPQRAWLLRDLAGVDRARTPWIIVMFHVPWYNSNSGHFKEAWRAQEALEETLYAAGVDVVLNGHVHSYERSHPVKGWSPDPCGVVHLVVGDGGNYEGPYGSGWRQPQPPWSAFREGSFGAGRLEIHNATHATWQWRRTTCVAPAGETGLNETWFSPTGDGGRNCSTVPDVSAQAMEAVDAAVIVRDVVACPNRAVGSGPGRPGPVAPPPSGDGSGERGRRRREARWATASAAAIGFLSLGWAGTLFGLLRVYALLRRERGSGVMEGVMSTTSGRRRHVVLREDVDDMELEL